MAETMTVVTQQGLVFSFDGAVLEVFSHDGSRRIHLSQIRALELGKGFLGGSAFSVKLKTGQTYALQVKLEDAEAVLLQRLADAVDAAMK